MSMATFAQKNADAAVAELTSKVELSDVQEAKLLSIETQFASDLKEILKLKESEPKTYYNKLSYLKEVKLGAIKDLINEDQMDSYVAYRTAKVQARNAKYKKWQADDLSELEIRILLMEAM